MKGRKLGAPLPDDFVATLRRTYADRDNVTLNALLFAAMREGWTTVRLSDALGISRQAVSQRAQHAWQDAVDQVSVPRAPLEPPRYPRPPAPPTPNQLHLTPDVVQQLRVLFQVARTVNGVTPAGDPRRAISAEYSALLAALMDKGVTGYAIAKALGIEQSGVYARLRRHGHRTTTV